MTNHLSSSQLTSLPPSSAPSPLPSTSRPFSSLKECNLCPWPARQLKCNPLTPRPLISCLYPWKFLHQPDSCIAALQQGKLLAQADPWPAIERQILPAGPQMLPPLWLELLR